MGAGVGGGDEGLGSEILVDSDSALRAFNLSESAVSGVSILFGIGSADLRCFSKDFQVNISTISFHNDVGRVFIYFVSEGVKDDVRSALSRARSASSGSGVGAAGILLILKIPIVMRIIKSCNRDLGFTSRFVPLLARWRSRILEPSGVDGWADKDGDDDGRCNGAGLRRCDGLICGLAQ